LSLTFCALEEIPEVRPGDSLGTMLVEASPHPLSSEHVVVVCHKVVSKAEGRLRRLDSVSPGEQALELARAYEKDPRMVEVVLSETQTLLRQQRGVLICETVHGLVCANAGVDASNTGSGEEVVLLPSDPDASARRLRHEMCMAGASPPGPGVIVSDSFGRPWRVGQTDVAIGAAGIRVLDDWRGRRDSFGRELQATQIASADSIAAASDLARRKDGRRPAVCVSGAEHLVTMANGPGAKALQRARDEDLFR
jgi:coenzyme F420-0:L-glutamate ligase / coenzyme F420-1:gamma-L-glutamate ligase